MSANIEPRDVAVRYYSDPHSLPIPDPEYYKGPPILLSKYDEPIPIYVGEMASDGIRVQGNRPMTVTITTTDVTGKLVDPIFLKTFKMNREGGYVGFQVKIRPRKETAGNHELFYIVENIYIKDGVLTPGRAILGRYWCIKQRDTTGG